MTSNSEFSPVVGQEAHDNLSPAQPSASDEPKQAKNQASRAIREIVETLLLAALIFLLVRLVVLNFRVDGESMLPNLDNGQMLLVNRNAYQHLDVGGNRYYPFDPPERGDVVVFDPPKDSDKPYIKRIVGLPGEEITFGQGHVFVDGVQLPEDYIQDPTKCNRNREDRCNVVVPEDHVFVLGDHRSNSSDSRVFGVVPIENIVGKAWVSYWPPNDIGFVPHEDYEGIGEQPGTNEATAP
jgi:signal peptidase I